MSYYIIYGRTFSIIKKVENMDIKRAALYIRVSTEEQVREGYSVEAQRDNLKRYAKNKGYSVVGVYADEGITARKKYTNRKEFMRLLDDVEAGKIDIILFIKLDRWFRNVGDYYKIQEILERNNVGWTATTENYDTTTANGRLYVNIRLAVAQDESDRTSERIKFVFAKKVADGEVITGSASFGYKIEGKKLVFDENEKDFVRLVFDTYRKLRSVNGVCAYLNNFRDKPLSYTVYYNVLNKNLPLYAGIYRDNENFAPPYITLDEYKELKAIREVNRPPRNNGKTYSYIFTGLLKCGKCGRSLTGGGYNKNYGNSYYRCSGSRGVLCADSGKRVNERKLEKQLFSILEDEINKYKVDYEINKTNKNKPKINKATIDKKLSRLRKLYINELIEIEDYKKEYDMLQSQLEDLEEFDFEEEKDFSNLEKLLDSDFRNIYDGLSNLDKRALWHSVIESITISNHEITNIVFK